MLGWSCDYNGICWSGTYDPSEYEVVRSFGYFSLAKKHNLTDLIGSGDTIFYESCSNGCDSSIAFTFVGFLPP